MPMIENTVRFSTLEEQQIKNNSSNQDSFEAFGANSPGGFGCLKHFSIHHLFFLSRYAPLTLQFFLIPWSSLSSSLLTLISSLLSSLFSSLVSLLLHLLLSSCLVLSCLLSFIMSRLSLCPCLRLMLPYCVVHGAGTHGHVWMNTRDAFLTYTRGSGSARHTKTNTNTHTHTETDTVIKPKLSERCARHTLALMFG